VKASPRRMLIELPVANEIDEMALSSPDFKVRTFEFDLGAEKADLNYPPCKGQAVLVIRGEKGTVLMKRHGTAKWAFPTGRIGMAEPIAQGVKRVAKDECGLGLKSIELAGMYDVVRHYSDITVKRLHFVYVGRTDDTAFAPERGSAAEPGFHRQVSEGSLEGDIDKAALEDSSEK